VQAAARAGWLCPWPHFPATSARPAAAGGHHPGPPGPRADTPC